MSVNESPRAFDALVKKDLDALARTSHDPAAVAARDQRQQTPLHWAARLGVVGATDVLVRGGPADPNAQDQWGDTPLHLAIRHQRPLTDVQALLRAGANPSLRNQSGLTPAYEALCLGQEAVFDQVAPMAAWDSPANAEQHTLRQCVTRQRPQWLNKAPPAPTLSAAFESHVPVTGAAASIAPATPASRRPWSP